MSSSGVKRHRSRNHRSQSGTSIGDWIKVESLGRIGRLVIGIVLLVWLGWQIIGNTIADTTAQIDPQVSLAWRPDDALALVTLAENQLSASKAEAPTQRIADMARHALEANPLAEGALRVLASSADQEGRPQQAGMPDGARRASFSAGHQGPDMAVQ